MTGALVRVEGPLEFTPEQSQMIRDTFANGATESEFAVLMEVAKARRLNPLLRQIHFVKRWDKSKGRDVWSTQTSIDGLRAIAERSAEYDGQDEPEFAYDDRKLLICAKVRVYRKGIARPFVGVAHFAEYVQLTKDRTPTSFWRDKPHVMLAKCAEALGLRKAFPEDMAGLYVKEEMDAADNPPPPVVAPTPEPPKALPEPVASLATDEVIQALFDRIDTAKTIAELKMAGSAVAEAKLSTGDRLRMANVYQDKKKALSAQPAVTS